MDLIWACMSVVAWVFRTLSEAAVPAVAIGLASWLAWRRCPRLRAPLAVASVVVAVGWVALCVILRPWPPGPPVRLFSTTVLPQDFLWTINPLGLAAIALAPLAVWAVRRRAVAPAPARTSRFPRWLVFLPVGFLVLAAAAYVVYVWPPLPDPLYYLRQTRFDPDRWQALAEDEGFGRADMLRSLFRDERITGKRRSALVTLLGAPEAYHLVETQQYLPAHMYIKRRPQPQSRTGIGYPVADGWDIDPYYLYFYLGPDGQVWAYDWIAS